MQHWQIWLDNIIKAVTKAKDPCSVLRLLFPFYPALLVYGFTLVKLTQQFA